MTDDKPRAPDITHLLRARLREALLADGVPEEEVDEATDELMAFASERGQQMREAREG